MADSDATLHAAGDVIGAVARRPRSNATVHGGDGAALALFVMRAQRIDVFAGPVTWTVTGAADPSGAQYPDGPGVLDPASIAVVGRVV